MILAIDPGNIESGVVLLDDNLKPIEYGKKTFKIGITENAPNFGIDVDRVIEDIQNTMYDEIGEVAEDYLDDKRVIWEIGMEDMSSLASALSSVGIRAADIKINGKIKVKSKEEKQLERLYKFK